MRSRPFGSFPATSLKTYTPVARAKPYVVHLSLDSPVKRAQGETLNPEPLNPKPYGEQVLNTQF